MTSSDLYAFTKIIRDYTHHVSNNPNSLLARIYGVFTIKMEDLAPVNLVVMGNTKFCDDKNILNVFDLKGS